jgi:methionyl aminopeptidase
MNSNIKKYTNDEFQKMQKACDLTSYILDELAFFVKEGISTEDIDIFCSKIIREHGAEPACLGYRGYPKTVCTSVNSVVCHGIPSKSEILKNGDIINIDVTVILDGWYGDSSRMFYVGKVQKFAQLLCERTYECLEKAISIVKPGITLGCIGQTIQKHAESYGYSVVRDYCGHGVGQEFHLPPYVMHHGKSNTGAKIEEGMIFTIEPMINLGSKEVETLKDGWTVLTKDRKLSAQFEHCIGVTSEGCIVFTKSKKGFDRPPYKIN